MNTHATYTTAYGRIFQTIAFDTVAEVNAFIEARDGDYSFIGEDAAGHHVAKHNDQGVSIRDALEANGWAITDETTTSYTEWFFTATNGTYRLIVEDCFGVQVEVLDGRKVYPFTYPSRGAFLAALPTLPSHCY